MAQCLSPSTASKPIQTKLARLQRQLSKKVKFSSNWKSKSQRIQRLHSHIANTRRDYLPQGHNDYQQNHAMIVIEDLKVASMSKSAVGTTSQPGAQRQANRG